MANMVTLHRGQSQVMRYLFPKDQPEVARYACVVASRGYGKSVLGSAVAVKAVDYLMRLSPRIPNKNVSIVAPTYGQVTDIYWPLLTTMFNLKAYAIKHSERDGFFLFPGNVSLNLWSYEASERMRGSGQFLVVGDEVTTWEGRPGLQDSFESIIQPTMITRWPGNHRFLAISTPRGKDYFHEMYLRQDVEPDRWKSFHYTYRDSPYLSEDEINKIKGNIDPLRFAREYEASFQESGANVFYCFDRELHLDPNLLPLQEGEDVHCSIDFNVGVMACTVWAIRGSQMHAIGEFSGHPDTDSLAKRLVADFPGRRIFAYPDPAGRARKTSSLVGITDFSILQAHKIITLAHDAHPPIVDSVNAVNRKLKNAHGAVEMFFCPKRAPRTISSVERTVWLETNPNVAVIDKRTGVEHFSDGVRYITDYRFPVRSSQKSVHKGFGF